MSQNCCANVVDGIVSQVIVCANCEWASRQFGGVWVNAGEQLVGIGWIYHDGTFEPPPPIPDEP